MNRQDQKLFVDYLMYFSYFAIGSTIWIILHECSHAIAGLLQGYSIVMFNPVHEVIFNKTVNFEILIAPFEVALVLGAIALNMEGSKAKVFLTLPIFQNSALFWIEPDIQRAVLMNAYFVWGIWIIGMAMFFGLTVQLGYGLRRFAHVWNGVEQV